MTDTYIEARALLSLLQQRYARLCKIGDRKGAKECAAKLKAANRECLRMEFGKQ